MRRSIVQSCLDRNQSICVLLSFVQGRRSLMVASTRRLWLRDTSTLVPLSTAIKGMSVGALFPESGRKNSGPRSACRSPCRQRFCRGAKGSITGRDAQFQYDGPKKCPDLLQNGKSEGICIDSALPTVYAFYKPLRVGSKCSSSYARCVIPALPKLLRVTVSASFFGSLPVTSSAPHEWSERWIPE